MKKTSITEAKNNLSALIDGLKGRSAVLIRDRGRPVARLEPVTADLDAAEGDYCGSSEGIVGPRRGEPPPTLFSQPPPRAKAGASAIKALLEERQESR